MTWLVTWEIPKLKGEDSLLQCEDFATEEECKHKARELTDLALDRGHNVDEYEISIWQLRHEVLDCSDGPQLHYVVDRECNECDTPLFRREDGLLCERQAHGSRLVTHKCPAND